MMARYVYIANGGPIQEVYDLCDGSLEIGTNTGQLGNKKVYSAEALLDRLELLDSVALIVPVDRKLEKIWRTDI